MVKKAIIAAAGRATRFFPIAKAYPKELLPILDKPIIQYLVEELIGARVKEIAIVHRPGDHSIKNYFLNDQRLEKFLEKNGKKKLLNSLEKIQRKVKFSFFPQPRRLSYGTGAPVLAAQRFIGHDPFVYIYGDDLILEKRPGDHLKKMIASFEKYRALAVTSAQKVPWSKVEKYGTMRLKENTKVPQQIEALEEKLPPKKAPSNLAHFGREVFSVKIIEVLKKQKIRLGELLLTDAITTLAKQGVVLMEVLKSGQWLTTGDPERWLQANIEYQKFDL